ncbi:MAG: hypothetical protein AAF399_09940 [Bacteroidota bacterium]
MGRVGVLLVGWMLLCQAAVACQCFSYNTLELIEEAELVMIGQVSEVVDTMLTYCAREPTGEWVEYQRQEILYRFAVVHQVKGQPAQEIYLNTASSGASCGFSFAPGQDWLICVDSMNYFIAHIEGTRSAKYFTDFCDGSTYTEYLTPKVLTALTERYGIQYDHPASHRQIVRLGLICLIVLAGVGAFFSLGLLRLSDAS